jgi:hypothetical protein
MKILALQHKRETLAYNIFIMSVKAQGDVVNPFASIENEDSPELH